MCCSIVQRQACRELAAELLPLSPLAYLGDHLPVQRFWRRARERLVQRLILSGVRKGTNGFSTNGVTANFMFFDRRIFWVLPLTYFYLHKSARASLFPQSITITFAPATLVLTPSVRNQGVPCIRAEGGEGDAGLVAASAALRRPGPGATEAERAAAQLVSAGELEEALGARYAREPVPPGVRLETFSLPHFARCLPHLVGSAQGLSEGPARVARLSGLYKAFLALLEDPAGRATLQELRGNHSSNTTCLTHIYFQKW